MQIKCIRCKIDIIQNSPATKYCRVCKLEMIKMNNRKFWHNHKKAPRNVTCDVCGNQFMTTHNNKKSCSDNCRWNRWFVFKSIKDKENTIRRKTRQLTVYKKKYEYLLK